MGDLSPPNLRHLAPKIRKMHSRSDSDDIIKKQQYAESLVSQGKLKDAEKIYREIIKKGIVNHMIYGNLATILGMQSKLEERIKLLSKALQIKPNYHIAHNNLGLALQEQGDLKAAVKSFKTALRFQPKYIAAHANLGNVLQEKGELNTAIQSYKTAIKINPNYTVAHYNLGLALHKQGNLTEAIKSYKTAIKLNPNQPSANNNLGLALHKQGNLTEAIKSYKAAISLNPKQSEIHYNLGISFKEQGDLNSAIISYKNAIQLKPDYSEAHINLGNALQEQGELIAAITSYKTALKIKPQNADAHFNLGIALKEQKNLSQAIESFKRAIQLNPNYSEAHWSCALTTLLAGDYKNGWRLYEHRFQHQQYQNVLKVHPSSSRWGGEPLEENTKLFLISEQGLGDTLQFMRYALALKNKGISISLCAQSKLHSLIQASGIDKSPLTHDQAKQITNNKWIPLLSVPAILHVSPSNPIITYPYINTTHQLLIKCQDILSKEKRPVIGINWQGNPDTEKTWLRGRSLTLETFSSIAKNRQISLLSLQKGFGSEQLKTCSFKEHFVSCQDQINATWNFLETAAIIANCDLVITCDTSVAHLAGGMGKNTWLLLHKVPEWRWGIEGNATFWYPSMELYRQKKKGDWNEVMEEIVLALQENF